SADSEGGVEPARDRDREEAVPGARGRGLGRDLRLRGLLRVLCERGAGGPDGGCEQRAQRGDEEAEGHERPLYAIAGGDLKPSRAETHSEREREPGEASAQRGGEHQARSLTARVRTGGVGLGEIEDQR